VPNVYWLIKLSDCSKLCTGADVFQSTNLIQLLFSKRIDIYYGERLFP
jgi:hypothetical protein